MNIKISHNVADKLMEWVGIAQDMRVVVHDAV